MTVSCLRLATKQHAALFQVVVKKFLLLGVVLLSGCSRVVVFDNPFYLKSASPRINVNLDASLREFRQQPIKRRTVQQMTFVGQGWFRNSYDIGEALKCYFEHDPNSPVSDSYVSSAGDNLYETYPGRDFLFGPTSGNHATYTLIVQVRFDGDSRSIEGNGTGDSKDANDAAQQAIERAVIDIYKQIAGLLK